jgi:hypothetical protein
MKSKIFLKPENDFWNERTFNVTVLNYSDEGKKMRSEL